MYKLFIRPILFLLYPEKVHHLVVKLTKISFKIPFVKPIVSLLYCKNGEKLAINVAGLNFKNPVGLAAGFDKDATFYKEFRAFGFGFIEIGTVTPKPQPGNPLPRSFRLTKDKALINRMGFNNMGVDAAVERLKNRPKDFIIGGNIGKNTATPNENAVEDYLYCFKKLYNYVDYFVVNVSCPNVSNLHKLQDQDSLTAILQTLNQERLQMSTRKPVFLKIAPDLNNYQIDETLSIVQQQELDGLVVTNTTVTRDNLLTDSEKIKEIGNGGLSGKPLRMRSTEMIKYITQKTDGKLALVGVGGIFTAEDAKAKLDAGAHLVQVYTGFIYEGPSIVKRILKVLLKN